MQHLAISNIAWQPEEDAIVLELLEQYNVRHIEISPFRTSANAQEMSSKNAEILVQYYAVYGIDIVALQAIMYRHTHLSIFGKDTTRQACLKHIVHILDFAQCLHAKTVIFGSPKNKKRGALPYEKAFEHSVDFFKKVAEHAAKRNVIFCLEPTPGIFGADFVRNTREAMDVVQAVDHVSFRLNFDIGSLLLNKEHPDELIPMYTEYIGHVHISEPHLHTIRPEKSFHAHVAQLLRESGYANTVSIEMLHTEASNLTTIRDTVTFVQDAYQLA